jgi:hypothetical protein
METWLPDDADARSDLAKLGWTIAFATATVLGLCLWNPLNLDFGAVVPRFLLGLHVWASIIITMIAATPVSEGLARRFGHRVACLVGAGLLAGSLAGLSWGVEHGYVAIAACVVVMTVGLRTVMTICAVALIDAMPANRTSIGAALNDTAQEVGTSVGTAVVGTLIAVLVTTQLPAGTWSSELVASFFHGERITYAVLAVVVGLVAAGGALTLTSSRTTDEAH